MYDAGGGGLSSAGARLKEGALAHRGSTHAHNRGRFVYYDRRVLCYRINFLHATPGRHLDAYKCGRCDDDIRHVWTPSRTQQHVCADSSVRRCICRFSVCRVIVHVSNRHLHMRLYLKT